MPRSRTEEGLSRTVAVFVFSGVVLAGGIAVWRHLESSTQDHPSPGAESSEPNGSRAEVLGYLAQPDSSGPEFAKQLLGDATLQRLNLDTQVAYFSLPEKEGDASYPASAVSRLTTNPSEVRFSPREQGILTVDDLMLPRMPEQAHFFATPVENLRFDGEAMLHFPYRLATYAVTLRETLNFLRNETIRGGLLTVETGRVLDGRSEVFMNHGAFVALPGEPSLKRLVNALVADLPTTPDAREQRVQRLLDFVSDEIAYDAREAAMSIEFLKRPNEVLMTRRGDCSSKSILLASLLEQLGEAYLFAYIPGHITVAVPQGGFPQSNHLGWSWQGKDWLLAEATVPGFRIGVGRVTDEKLFAKCEFLQSPANPNVIVSRLTGLRLSFR